MSALEKLNQTRKQIFEYLQEQGIGVQVHYVPLHFHSFFQKQYGYEKGDF